MGNLAYSILDRLLNLTRQNGWNFTEIEVAIERHRKVAHAKDAQAIEAQDGPAADFPF